MRLRRSPAGAMSAGLIVQVLALAWEAIWHLAPASSVVRQHIPEDSVLLVDEIVSCLGVLLVLAGAIGRLATPGEKAQPLALGAGIGAGLEGVGATWIVLAHTADKEVSRVAYAVLAIGFGLVAGALVVGRNNTQHGTKAL